MPAESDRPTVKADALATLLKLTARRVQQLAKEGVVVRAGRGRYDLVASVQGYVGYLGELAERRGGSSDDLDLQNERARLAREKADAASLDNAERKRELIPAEFIEHTLVEVAQAAAAQFDAVPIRIKQRIPDLTARDTEIITEEIARARNGFADFAATGDDGAPGARSRGRRKRA